jgi:hypothetical protein
MRELRPQRLKKFKGLFKTYPVKPVVWFDLAHVRFDVDVEQNWYFVTHRNLCKL